MPYRRMCMTADQWRSFKPQTTDRSTEEQDRLVPVTGLLPLAEAAFSATRIDATLSGSMMATISWRLQRFVRPGDAGSDRLTGITLPLRVRGRRSSPFREALRCWAPCRA
jgi:hypothetical protein